MIYNEFCGRSISRLGFGAMRFPRNFEDIQVLIDKAMASGINYYDTAYIYHNSEVPLGKALSKYPRDSYAVTSKMPPWLVKDEADLERIFNESLQRVGVDYFDYYLIHSIGDAKVVKDKNIYPFLAKKKAEGKIKNLGFSIHAPLSVLKEMLEIGPFDFVQIQLNYMDVVHEPGLAGYKLLEEKNIPVVIMEPLKGGTLANIPSPLDAPFRSLGDSSNASYGFKWLLQFKNIKTILSGMNQMTQLEDNLNTFNNYTPLTEVELAAIKQVKENIIEMQKVPCTGCSYCMPCPKGVNIPYNFRVWNTINLNKKTSNPNWIGDTDFNDNSGPLLCVGCGKCMEHCPQKIQIPVKIQEMITDLNLKKDK